MVSRPFALALLCLSALVLPGCSGGGSTASVVQPGCDQAVAGEGMCLVSCNLGCSLLGCAITDIAQNQPIVMAFSQNIDPTTVNTGSFSLRTAAGEEPVGQYLVSGSTITFVPEIKVVGGASFFGFEANETYTLTLPGGVNEINALRSTAGDRLSETTVCNLAVTRGVIDLDGAAPVGRLRSPATTTGVPSNTRIVIEFSEIIDVTPFLQATPGNEPIQVLAAKSRTTPTGELECDPTSSPVPVRGRWDVENDVVRQVSTASFTIGRSIPDKVCMIATITTAVRDLSGVPSQGQVFTYFVSSGSGGGTPVVEENFSSSVAFDRNVSSGSWAGGATPGELGGDGLHGDFDLSIATPKGGGVFELNTDNHVIPASRTLSGKTEVVTDGVFRFTRFVLPSGVTVRFVGSKPAQVFVRGALSLEGTIDLSGTDQVPHDAFTLAIGQPGTVGGAGAGAGGRGADRGDGIAHQGIYNGRSGESLQLPAGHAYSSSTPSSGTHLTSRVGFGSVSLTRAESTTVPALPSGTGGAGSLQFPLSGKNSALVTTALGFASAQVSAGGGGGGYLQPGKTGQVDFTYVPRRTPPIPTTNNENMGPPAPGGSAFRLPTLPPTGVSVADFYLIGGSGGGGGGSHPFKTSSFAPVWISGCGGAGGGGALLLRVGGSATMLATAALVARGGNGADVGSFDGYPATGGGGSGGTIVLQAPSRPTLTGLIDVSGGVGGVMFDDAIGGGGMQSSAGDGSPGYIRVEVPGPVPSDPTEWTGATLPPATSLSVSELEERDLITAVQSLWYRTGSLFDPVYLRYEIEATVDGNPVLYSDDPSVGSTALNGPVNFYIQGADEDAAGNVNLGTLTLWRNYVGPFGPNGERSLFDEGGSAFRFQILFDRSFADDITIHAVRVFFEPF